MTESFRLYSGRLVHVEWISIKSTYEGVLEGKLDIISAHIWKETPVRLEREFGPRVLILKPITPRLPSYRYVVRLTSGPISETPSQDSSCLDLCWFQDGISKNLIEDILVRTKGFRWEEHATTYRE
jgi:hypothetical protein